MRAALVIRRLTLSIFLLVVGLSLTATPATAATLLLDGSGILTGATGVDVGGTLYDVEFLEGTCVDLFSGCDAISDFTFQSQVDAQAASAALLAQVFLDGPDGDFDTHPELTFGCSSLSVCLAMVPHTVSPTSVVAFAFENEAILADVGGVTFVVPPNLNIAPAADVTWARFSPSDAAPVPEPTSMFLLGTGLVGLYARRWRQRKP
jgi:hypothetical protein